jgi:sialic acid synthase SpsE
MSEINLCGRMVGDNHPPLVIAEIGINHEGDFGKAKQMITDAYESNAECVKFQTHIIEDEMIENDVIPENADESIWKIMKRCSLSEDEDIELKEYTEKLGMIYLSTPFSRSAADRLEKINVCAFKIGSGECNNFPLIEHIAKYKKPIILSTGMNSISSITKSVDIIQKHQIPYALLHVTSLYPTPYGKVRLGAVSQLKSNFPDAVIGLSDHSIGNYTCYASIALGASILEKHFTSDKNWPGPDISISINQIELKDLILGSNAIFESLGGEKTILDDEKTTAQFAYASVVTTQEIKKGEFFTMENIWVKRPGTGQIRPIDFKKIINKTATCDIQKNKQLTWDMID